MMSVIKSDWKSVFSLKKCKHEAKMLGLIEIVQQDLPEAKLIINQNCKIEVANLKELKEK